MLPFDRFYQSNNMSNFLKIYLIKRLMRFIVLILAVFTFSISCSDRGDEFQTFLEMYDGTEWLLSNDNIDKTIYIRLNNYKSKLVEEWDYNSEFDCYGYCCNIFDAGNFEFEENSMEKLVVIYDEGVGPFESMTFTIQGHTLKVVITFFEWENETVYFNKASVSVDDLEICYDQVEKSFINYIHI